MLLAETSLYEIISNSTYLALAAVALWGLYQIVIVWTRVGQKRFKTEEQQDAFMDDVEQMLRAGDYEGVHEYCDGDVRAIPQMIDMAVVNRDEGFKRAKQIMMDRFQRDVMSDLEYRLSWVSTVIKSAPMIGLFGTVFGMMGAFKTLATAEQVEPSALAGDIQVALVTTASGLAIAIPLMLLVATVMIRIAKMEDLLGSGLQRFFEAFKVGLAKSQGAATKNGATANAEAVAAGVR
ncbi:MotA/TolQ/ExbB proton channel family protein [Rhodopirellula bahusiensis]|uniref:Biopolymer transporter ExbB n=1 Tax=Rhodopirellula bahusiensis TaxID=2014065 RepID=A0A2G1W572_9BACT|nr:MotA/TolQ/ExbB proton channel family protein [Rhodopirellula bahusiensis]PHQ34176.1 biopolymer transporter ExbB [Rhodopirellula bahusiensis]